MRFAADTKTAGRPGATHRWLGFAAAMMIVTAVAGCAADRRAGPLASRARSAAPAATAAPVAESPNLLVWDSTRKILEPRPGEKSAGFEFTVTNVSDRPVTILQIRPTCGCTIVEMPSQPWLLPPHTSGSFIGNIDFPDEQGTLTKAIFVNSSVGTQMLMLEVRIPEYVDPARVRNQRIAARDRQAVFRGDCARCHVTPTLGKSGEALFVAACGVCHFARPRAETVPDLLRASTHRDAAYWRRWIADGKPATLMPAWSQVNGGPLTEAQIESLVTYALATLPTEPPPRG